MCTHTHTCAHTNKSDSSKDLQGPSLESRAGLIFFFFNQEELVRMLYKALSFLGLHSDELGYCVAQG